MREVRIYQEGVLDDVPRLDLSLDAGHHVSVVLRMVPGDALTLFCGDNREFLTTIESVHKKKVTVVIHEMRTMNRESDCKIHLAQGISKGERMEWVIQKATELGVASITPLITARCSVKQDKDRLTKKHTQWESIAIAACEQSGRNRIPKIHSLLRLDVFLQQCQTKSKLILHPGANQSWRNGGINNQEITLVVGSEGGFTEEEIKQAIAHQFQLMSLGPRVLRTETAALAAISVLQAMHGDL